MAHRLKASLFAETGDVFNGSASSNADGGTVTREAYAPTVRLGIQAMQEGT